jgi:hypothetical protein
LAGRLSKRCVELASPQEDGGGGARLRLYEALFTTHAANPSGTIRLEEPEPEPAMHLTPDATFIPSHVGIPVDDTV